MTIASSRNQPVVLPGHLDLPENDGTFVTNFRELPQSLVITESLLPVLDRLHPDGRFAIGQDSGIYWREADPPERGSIAPDWFYVPGVDRILDGHYRRSYVLWKELVPPRIVLEFASGDGDEERDRTPWRGKFWIYEQMIRPIYYGIFHVESGGLEVFQLAGGRFVPIAPNPRGHFPVVDLDIELGTWRGRVLGEEACWLRAWDSRGNLLLSDAERVDEERRRADEERRRADEERRRADEQKRRADEQMWRAEALAAKLRALGIEPDGPAGSS